MTSNVFPESMDKIDYKESEKALKIVDDYIRYICERTTFAVSNVTKKAALAGNTSSEAFAEIDDLKRKMSTLQSTVYTWQAAITGCQSDIQTIQGDITTLQNNYTSLEARVKALEDKG